MGAIGSRQNAGVEEVDIAVNHAYRYPPKSGNYFSNHFIMGGERFDTAQPEMYLFGENSDLNFLGSRPAPFPYPAPSASEPSRTLKALVNIRKESLRFMRVPDGSLSLKEPENRSPSQHFNIEFTFDCDVRCAITIMYFCTEEISPSGLVYTPKDVSMNSETFHYKRGANQQFSQVSHIFDPSQYTEDELSHSFDKEVMPIVILCEAEEGEDMHQIHSTIAIVEKHAEGYALKPLKQKLFVDGLCYLLQEIYGIENKTADTSKAGAEDDTEDNGAECVICMCDLRDTLILPCRHLCLCNCCADSLRYQANNCPICRAPFRALLQIKALQKTIAPGGGSSSNAAASTNTEATEGVPAGYQSVPLIEALNGPSVAPQQPPVPPFQDMYVRLPQNAVDDGLLDGTFETCELSRGYQDNFGSKGRLNGLEDSTTQTDNTSAENGSINKTPCTQMRMSVLLAQESTEDSALGKLEESGTSPPNGANYVPHKKRKSRYHKEDSVTSVNETSSRSKEFSDALGGRKLKKSISSPVSPSEANQAKSSTELDDAEESPETLGLLDPLQTCLAVESRNSQLNPSPDAKRAASCHSPPQKAKESSLELEEGMATASSHHTFPDETDVGNMIDEDFGAACIGIVDDLDLDASSNHLPSSISFDGDSSSAKPNRGSKKGKQKHRLSSSRRSRGSIGSAYASDTYCGDDSTTNQPLESHSLPGTPLSTSSAISRTSDISVSSASSTKALIVSHPPPQKNSGGGASVV